MEGSQTSAETSVSQVTESSTAIVSHGVVDDTAREVYGSGPVHLRIGNGGAGATGLIKAIATDYLDSFSIAESIEWVSNHSRNTQLALSNKYIDIALTYERDQEIIAAAEGWSNTVGCVFHDHFCLCGPISDPAGVFSCENLDQALPRIANSKALFHSRADTSATMWKERSLWEMSDLAPWTNEDASRGWYKMSLSSPAEALINADKVGAYLIADRSTLMTLTRSQQISKTTVFFEPTARDHILMNSCYALLPTSQSEQQTERCRSFLSYLLSNRGQQVVASFGTTTHDQYSFFARVSDGFLRAFLRGGQPKDGCWIFTDQKPRL